MAKKPTYEELEQRVKELEKEALRLKKLGEVLGKSKEQYHDLYEHAPNAYFSASAEDGSIIRCNTAAVKLLGYDRNTLMGMKVFDLYADNPHGISKAQEVFKRFKQGESIRDVEMQMKHKDGYPIWISLSVEPVRDHDGNITESRSMVLDISDRKRTGEALRKSEEKYYGIFKNIHDVYYEATLDGIMLEASPSIEEVSHYKREEIIGQSLYDIYADPKKRDEFIKELLKNGKVTDYEILLKDKDGSPSYCSTTASLVSDKHGNPVKIIGSMRNINERKRIEEALRQSEAQKRAILDASVDRLRYVDKDMKIIWGNQATAMDLGMSSEDLVGQFCYKLFMSRDTPCKGCPTVRARETGRNERAVMHQPKAKGIKGESYWDTHCVPLKNDAGEIESFIQIARNITDQKRAMQALQESKETLQAILAASPIGIGLVHNHTLDWVNKAMYNMLDYEEGSLLGETARILYQDVKEYDRVGRELYPGLEENGIGQVETRWVKKDGNAVHCYLQASPLDQSDPGKGIIMAVMDISERKQAEDLVRNLSQMLIQAQERERQMVSYELHDSIAQNLSTLKIGCDTLFDGQSAISSELKGKMAKLSKIIEQTIIAVRDLAYDLRPPGLDEMGLVKALEIYCEEFSENSGVAVDFQSAGIDKLIFDLDIEIHLYRLVQEGLNNIRKHADAGQVTIKLVGASPNIILRIEDDGKGFDVKARGLALDNKKRMGLRSMQERVNLLQGRITIQSRPQKGTKIFIKFPFKE